MKKMLFAVIACAMLASPVLAEDFATMKTSKLDKIAGKMEKFKDSDKVTAFLQEKKACVEAATDMDGLKACVTKFPPEKIQELLMAH